MSLSKVNIKYAVAGGAAALAVSYAVYSYMLTRPPARTPEGKLDMKKEVAVYFTDKAAKEQKSLYKKEAFQRSTDISEVSYKIAYAFLKGGKNYHGQVQIMFNLTKQGAESDEIFVDYRGEKVLKLIINGFEVKDGEPFRDHRVYFPKQHLKEGKNTVYVRYVSEYVKDCQGVHYFLDKDDGEEYLYSQFEAADAHKAFPCFDQPDLKATYTLVAIVPRGWVALSTKHQCTDTTHSGTKQFSDQLSKYGIDEKEFLSHFYDEPVSCFEFGTSPKISVYLFSIIAGPYVMHESDKPEVKNYKFPLRLYSRKSVAKYVAAAKEDYFNVTKSGIDYYEKLFSTPYPFDKLDQVFVPDYNMGAMENVGCVIYRDDYVQRDELFSDARKEAIFNVFLHEISHMWFGNLVTMKWWDDLWLNESFANYVSYICLDEAPGLEQYKSAWTLFLDEAFWGLAEDQTDTTHPISVDAIHTEAAQDIFDGISYGKGAAWLNQTFHFFGREVFSIGIASYFKEYAFKNTQLPDFIRHLDQAAKQLKIETDLTKWTDTWLKTAGCNILWHDIVEEDGKIKKFTVQQRANEHGEGNQLRAQKYQCAFYNEKMEVVKVVDIVTREDKETFDLEELVGEPAPYAYHINYKNFGYGKFKIDDKSLKVFEEKLSVLDDTFSRTQLYLMMYDMLKTHDITGAHLLDVCKKQIATETASAVITPVMRQIIPSIIKSYIPRDHYTQCHRDIFELIVDKVLPSGAIADNATKHLLLDAALTSARNEDHLKQLPTWFKEGFVFTTDGKKLDQVEVSKKHKHAVVGRVWSSETIPMAEKQALLDELEKIDKSDWLDNTKKHCESACPENKQKMWDFYFNLDDNPEIEGWGLHSYQHSMRGFNQPQQSKYIEKFEDQFFEKITAVVEKKGRFVAEAYFYFLRPMTKTDNAFIKRYEDLHAKIKKESPDSTFYLNMLKETIYDLKKQQKAQEASAKYLESKK